MNVVAANGLNQLLQLLRNAGFSENEVRIEGEALCVYGRKVLFGKVRCSRLMNYSCVDTSGEVVFKSVKDVHRAVSLIQGWWHRTMDVWKMGDDNPTEDTRTLKELAEEVYVAQDACNLSGVVHSWAASISRLRELLPSLDTNGVNSHSINTLWADKVALLTGACHNHLVSGAYEEVNRLRKGETETETENGEAVEPRVGVEQKHV